MNIEGKPPSHGNMTDEWLAAEFEGGRHQRRVDMIMDIENR